MKIINEKGKLFGIINPVDLAIVLVALLCVAGIGWKVMSAAESAPKPDMAEVTFVVHVRGVMEDVVRGIEAAGPVGQTLLSNNAKTSATIESVTYSDYIAVAVNADGQHVTTVDPMRKDIIFTVTAQVDRAGNALTVGAQELRVNATFSVKTQTIHINGTIISLEF